MLPQGVQRHPGLEVFASTDLFDWAAHNKVEVFVSRAEPSILKCLHRIDNNVEYLWRILYLPNTDDYVDPIFSLVVTCLGKAPLVGSDWERRPSFTRCRLHLDEAERRVVPSGESASGVAVTKIAAKNDRFRGLSLISSSVLRDPTRNVEVRKFCGHEMLVDEEFTEKSNELVLISALSGSPSSSPAESTDIGVRTELSPLSARKSTEVEAGLHVLAKLTLDLSIAARDQICFDLS